MFLLHTCSFVLGCKAKQSAIISPQGLMVACLRFDPPNVFISQRNGNYYIWRVPLFFFSFFFAYSRYGVDKELHNKDKIYQL